MRPVNKGDSPYKTIGDYSQALPFLRDAIGLYCSYCGLPLGHVPEVEHKVSKIKGGSLTAWENLLLGCKYCNTRKGDTVTPQNAEEYLWPDQHNTAIAYTYEYGIPAINEDKLLSLDPSGKALSKARNLFDLVRLDNIPSGGQKDRRFETRNAAYETAIDSLASYQKGKETYPDSVDELSRQIVLTAKYSGFFSVWTTVFAAEPAILNALIDAFPGTEKQFFDENGLPKSVLDR